MGSLSASQLRDLTWTWVLSMKAVVDPHDIARFVSRFPSPLSDFCYPDTQSARSLVETPCCYTYVPSTLCGIRNYRLALQCEWIHSFQVTQGGVLRLRTFTRGPVDVAAYRGRLRESPLRGVVTDIRARSMDGESWVSSPHGTSMEICIQLDRCPPRDIPGWVDRELRAACECPETNSVQARGDAIKALVMGMPLEKFEAPPHWCLSQRIRKIVGSGAVIREWMRMHRLVSMGRANASDRVTAGLMSLSEDVLARIVRVAVRGP